MWLNALFYIYTRGCRSCSSCCCCCYWSYRRVFIVERDWRRLRFDFLIIELICIENGIIVMLWVFCSPMRLLVIRFLFLTCRLMWRCGFGVMRWVFFTDFFCLLFFVGSLLWYLFDLACFSWRSFFRRWCRWRRGLRCWRRRSWRWGWLMMRIHRRGRRVKIRWLSSE